MEGEIEELRSEVYLVPEMKEDIARLQKKLKEARKGENGREQIAKQF
jgi:hypothetical protein